MCWLTLNVEPTLNLFPSPSFTEQRPLHASHNDTNCPFPISASYQDESITLCQWIRKRQLFQLMTSPASVFVIQTFSTLIILFSARVFVGTLANIPPSIQYHEGLVRASSLCWPWNMSRHLHRVPSWMSLFCWMICESLTFFHLLPLIEFIWSTSAL